MWLVIHLGVPRYFAFQPVKHLIRVLAKITNHAVLGPGTSKYFGNLFG
jgi:hypothetical protein